MSSFLQFYNNALSNKIVNYNQKGKFIAEEVNKILARELIKSGTIIPHKNFEKVQIVKKSKIGQIDYDYDLYFKNETVGDLVQFEIDESFKSDIKSEVLNNNKDYRYVNK